MVKKKAVHGKGYGVGRGNEEHTPNSCVQYNIVCPYLLSYLKNIVVDSLAFALDISIVIIIL